MSTDVEDLTPPLPPPLVQHVGRAAMRFLAQNYFRIEGVGRHHVPASGPAIVLGNHPTFLDPYLVGWNTPRWITWLAWDEAFDWPLIGPLITAFGAVPLSLERASSSSLRKAYKVLEDERLLGIFFEGERTASGNFQINPPLAGAARIALRTGAPIVPFSLQNARRLWPREALLPARGKVRVHFHAPVDPEVAGGRGAMRKRAERLTAHLADVVSSRLPADGGFA